MYSALDIQNDLYMSVRSNYSRMFKFLFLYLPSVSFFYAIISSICYIFRGVLFLHICAFPKFSQVICFYFIPFMKEIIYFTIVILFNLQRLVLLSIICVFQKIFCALKDNVHYVVPMCNILQIFLMCSWFVVLLKFPRFLFIFCLVFLFIIECRALTYLLLLNCPFLFYNSINQ